MILATLPNSDSLMAGTRRSQRQYRLWNGVVLAQCACTSPGTAATISETSTPFSSDRHVQAPGNRVKLEPGARLASYEILAPLGKGGMGEVWHGRDTRLDRDVAIKALPAGHEVRA